MEENKGTTPSTEERPAEGQKLGYNELAAITNKIQQEYSKLAKHTEGLEKELESYRMNDYYNRVGLLFEIIKFSATQDNHFTPGFIACVYAEFESIVAPNKQDTEAPQEETVPPGNEGQ